jgi:hypothetical protein
MFARGNLIVKFILKFTMGVENYTKDMTHGRAEQKIYDILGGSNKV